MAKIHLNSNHWAAILLLMLVIPGFLFSGRPMRYYPVSAGEMLQEVLDMKDVITPGQVREIVRKGDPGYVLLDVRTPEDYIVGHIRGAVNVPMHDLLGKENLSRLKEEAGKTFIIYSDDEVNGCGPWMLLRQLGYENVKVMLGGYDFYVTGKPLPSEVEGKCYDEHPRYDYAKFFKQGGQMNLPEKKAPKIVVPRRKKKVVASGGC